MNIKKTIYISILIITLTLLLTLLFRQTTPERKITNNSIDSVTHNVTLYKYDDSGQLTSITTAPKVTHYQLRNTFYFSKPRMTLFNRNGVTWHARADSGNTLSNNRLIKLHKNVVFHQPGIINHPETTVITSELSIDPEKSYAITHQHTKLMQPGTILQGKGARINMKQGTVKILQQSQGSYQQQKQKKNV
jgi:lipopolysaccharide export system protein LptC